MQEDDRWIPPSGALGRLTSAAHERAGRLPGIAELRGRAADASPPLPFADALRAGDRVAVIAEIKRRSPSRGVLNAAMGAVDRGREYVDGGARALSVLTEPDEFGGSPQDVVEVRKSVAVPVLKKDFHVAPAQVWEARALGASAILFIVRALRPSLLHRLVDEASEAGVEPLLEVRSEDELSQALLTSARVIGVNARDLETLRIDRDVSAWLLPQIPSGRVRVAESGIRDAEDVRRATRLGAHAVLVGSSLSTSGNGRGAVLALSNVAREPDAS